MKIYFDHSNLISFFKQHDHLLFNDCLRMLKSQCDLFFNFSKQELSSDDALRTIIVQMTSGSNDSPKPIFSENPFPSRPLKTNTYVNLTNRDELTAAYLIDDERINLVKDKGNLLIAGRGEEIEVLSQLFFDDYQFNTPFTPKRDILKWDAIKPTVRPCTDIIIVDRYLFAEENLLDYNLHPLLAILTSKLQKNSKFNLIIFTDPTRQICVRGRRTEETPDWDKLSKNIKTYLKRKNGITATITIVATRNIREHDRTIFTNYCNSSSGDSLNYFDSKGEHITKGRHYEVHSHGLRANLKKGYYLLEDLQAAIDRLSSQKDRECIIGDKKCNFLSF